MTLSMIFSITSITENQLIVYAEKDNEKDGLSERDVAVLCGPSEDYEENKEQCNKLYDMLEEGKIKDDPDFEYD
ncbi:MAG TPA: hypothetical protein VF242_00695 [Nitrososphaeraceae archaeon]